MRVKVNLFDSFIKNIIYLIERKVKLEGVSEVYKSRSMNLALSHSFDEPKPARYRSLVFNGSSIIGFYLIERKVKVLGFIEMS